MKLMLGIDTGGTFTDAVIMDEAGSAILAKAKVPTSHTELIVGVNDVIEAVVSEVDVSAIGLVSVSTTLATNALVEGLGDPACLLVAGFGKTETERLRADVAASAGYGNLVVEVAGGHDALGSELQALDLNEVSAVATETSSKVLAYAVATQFSVRSPSHELAIAKALSIASSHPVTCSHELSSRLDAPRRAMTALLNARLISMIKRLEIAVVSALSAVGISAPLMMVRGDGSLATAEFMARRPIETILSGPAASVVGAGHLTANLVHQPQPGEDANSLIVDIGGTTTDIAALIDGRPTTTPDGAEVAGYRTMVDAVDLVTFGIGGDSEVRVASRRSGGPDDVCPLELGPARALPLSRLAGEHPAIVEALAGQLNGLGPAGGQGRLLVLVTSDHSVIETADGREREVLQALASGPGLESMVAPSNLALRVVSRLRSRGLVRVATLTPTDAALLLDPVEDSSDAGREAARLGAELLARQSDRQGRPVASSAVALAGLVEELLIETSAKRVLYAALGADGFEPPSTASEALLVAGRSGHKGFVSLSVGLGSPLTAVGASAGYYYPRVAERLGVAADIPPHAEVANAVGAVVGRVRIERRATVTRPRAGSYEVHAGVGQATAAAAGAVFRTVEEARAHARRLLQREVARLADEAGAAQAEIRFDWQARTATVEGKSILIEAILTAVATGRPRFA